MSELPSESKGIIGYVPRSFFDILLRRPRTPIVSYDWHIEASTAAFLALLADEQTRKNQTRADQPAAPSVPNPSPTSSSV